jgi:hypothetical protein
MPKLIFVVS